MLLVLGIDPSILSWIGAQRAPLLWAFIFHQWISKAFFGCCSSSIIVSEAVRDPHGLHETRWYGSIGTVVKHSTSLQLSMAALNVRRNITSSFPLDETFQGVLYQL